MRVLITGVAGHIGSSLARWILRNNTQDLTIVGVDDLSCGYIESVPDQVEFYNCDAGGLPHELFNKRFDAIFHLAAYAAECMSPFCRQYNYTNNLLPQAGLLNGLIRSGISHGRFVFASSIAVYGHGKPPFNESMVPKPADPYGVAKLACEQDLQIAGMQHGIDWVVIRPRNVYGPGQSIWQRYRNVIGLWMRAILEDKPLIVFGDGLQRRAFTYIDDILPCIWQAAFADQAAGQIINLGSEVVYNLLELLEKLAVVTEKSHALNIQHLPARFEAKQAWCLTEKSERLLGYKDEVELSDGLACMWKHVKRAWDAYPSRRLPLLVPRPEITVGMPPVWSRDFEQYPSLTY